MDMSLSKLWEMVEDREAWRTVAMGSQRVRRVLAAELNWAEEINMILKGSYEYFVKVNILKNGM